MAYPRIDFLYLSEPDMIQAGVTDALECVATMEEVVKLLDEGDYRMGGENGNSHGCMIQFPENPIFPGMPKDVFTYLVALTDMKLAPFLLLSTLGRIPGIFVSTYAASSMANGDMTQGIVIFIVVAIIVVIGILMRDRIIERLEKMKERGSH